MKIDSNTRKYALEGIDLNNRLNIRYGDFVDSNDCSENNKASHPQMGHFEIYAENLILRIELKDSAFFENVVLYSNFETVCSFEKNLEGLSAI